MKYSVIIPVFGNIGWLEVLLSSLETGCRRRHSEVIVVNDACEPEDTDRLDFLHRQGRIDVIVEHASRRGYATAINSGVRNSTADLIALVHSDVVLGPNTLGRLASRLKPKGPADIVSAVCCYAPFSIYVLSPEVHYRFVENYKPPNKPSCDVDVINDGMVGLYGDFQIFCKAVRTTRPDIVYSEDGYLFCAMMTRTAWETTGDMDDSFDGRGLADQLWVDKLRLSGGQLYVDRSTYCHHHGNATSDGPGFCYDKSCAEAMLHYKRLRREMLQDAGRVL